MQVGISLFKLVQDNGSWQALDASLDDATHASIGNLDYEVAAKVKQELGFKGSIRPSKSGRRLIIHRNAVQGWKPNHTVTIN